MAKSPIIVGPGHCAPQDVDQDFRCFLEKCSSVLSKVQWVYNYRYACQLSPFWALAAGHGIDISRAQSSNLMRFIALANTAVFHAEV